VAAPANSSPHDARRVTFAGWLLDLATRELFSPERQNVRLTGGEFELLTAFVAHPNEVLPREQLLDSCRTRENGSFDRTIDVRVGRLRRKLRDDPRQPRLIRTVRGGGYLFTAPVAAAMRTSAPGAGQ